MKPNLEAWTIVVNGPWNVRLFTLDWVHDILFEKAKKVEAEFRTAPGMQQFRFLSDNLLLIPNPHKVVVGVTLPSNEVLQNAENLIFRLLQLLIHTPITAFGINFGFIEDAPGSDLKNLFDESDTRQLVRFGSVSKRTVSHSLQLKDSILNVKRSLEANIFEVHFNFHYALRSEEGKSPVEIALDKIPNRTIKCKDYTYRLLKRVYKLVPEEEQKDAEEN